MSELYQKSLLKLELDQVLELLAECAGSQEGKEACRNLRPTSDLEDVQMMLEQTTAASDLCTNCCISRPCFAAPEISRVMYPRMIPIPVWTPSSPR